MTLKENETLRSAIMTISDPRGNWQFGWKLLCELADLSLDAYAAPFRKRGDEELRIFEENSGGLGVKRERAFRMMAPGEPDFRAEGAVVGADIQSLCAGLRCATPGW